MTHAIDPAPESQRGEIDHRATRRDYHFGRLDSADLLPQPEPMLAAWIEAARVEGNADPTAFCLATADAGGRPSARFVLLKHLDAAGLCFYTDSRSQKGLELLANPHAAAAFYWLETDRQVRAEGRVELLPETMAEDYFNQRPLGSRLAAAASVQSRPIESRAALEARVEALKQAFPQGDVPRNPAWRGYRLIPERWEFWQGRPSRLHDRFVYRRNADAGADWVITRLMP